jgi:hypothetical protein
MCLDSWRDRARQPEVNVLERTATTLGCILSHMTPIHALFTINFNIIFQRKLKSIKWSAPLRSSQNFLSIIRELSHLLTATAEPDKPTCLYEYRNV